MKTIDFHAFTLVLDGYDEITDALESAVGRAGCTDSTLRSADGLVWLEFDRAGPDRECVIQSALESLSAVALSASLQE